MEKKTFIIKTGEQSGCLKTKAFMADTIDEINIHQPETVIELDGWHDSLYTKAAVDAARELGREEAWELAQKIAKNANDGGYSTDDLRAIFEKTSMAYAMCAQIIAENTYQEAVDKINAWEEEKKAIHVGDIVLDVNGIKFAVMNIGDTFCIGLCADGTIGIYAPSELIKTGKTADIPAILSKIKEA